MENSRLFIFGEIWPMTLYYSTGTLAQFLSNFKNYNFDQNQVKVYVSGKFIKMLLNKFLLVTIKKL